MPTKSLPTKLFEFISLDAPAFNIPCTATTVKTELSKRLFKKLILLGNVKKAKVIFGLVIFIGC